MTFLRRIFAYLATLLGVVGVLLCLAVAVALWLWTGNVRSSIDQAAETVTGVTGRVSLRSSEAEQWLASAQRRVGSLRDDLRKHLADAGRNAGIDVAQFDTAIRQIRSTADEVREWLAFAQATGASVELITGLLEPLGVISSSELRQQTKDALAATVAQISDTMASLEELGEAIETARANDSPVDVATRRRAESFLARSATMLDDLGQRSRDLRADIDAIGDNTENLRSQVQVRLTLLQAVCTVLLLWQAVAQWSLARWGGRQLRSMAGEAV